MPRAGERVRTANSLQRRDERWSRLASREPPEGARRTLTASGANSTPPFAGPQAVLAYLSRYTHRVVISNSRLVA